MEKGPSCSRWKATGWGMEMQPRSSQPWPPPLQLFLHPAKLPPICQPAEAAEPPGPFLPLHRIRFLSSFPGCPEMESAPSPQGNPAIIL